MWHALKPATAIALVLGLGACATANGPFSWAHGANEPHNGPTIIPNRKSIDVQLNLADATLAGGDAAGAIRLYRSLAREYLAQARPRIALGKALLASGAVEEAGRAFDGALKLQADNREALTGLGRVELALHNPGQALNYFGKAIANNAADFDALNGKAVALDQLGRHDEAQAIYGDLMHRDPANIRVRNNYGLSLALAGKVHESTDVLAGLAAAPDAEPKIRQNLALAYGLAGKDGEAAHVARMDLDEDSVSSNIHYYQRLRHVGTPAEKGSALIGPRGVSVGAPAPSAHKAEIPQADKTAEAPASIPVAKLPLPPQAQAATPDMHGSAAAQAPAGMTQAIAPKPADGAPASIVPPSVAVHGKAKHRRPAVAASAPQTESDAAAQVEADLVPLTQAVNRVAHHRRHVAAPTQVAADETHVPVPQVDERQGDSVQPPETPVAKAPAVAPAAPAGEGVSGALAPKPHKAKSHAHRPAVPLEQHAQSKAPAVPAQG